jgi:hypothetical protein
MMDFPVLEDRADDAYQIQHCKVNWRAAGEGMRDKEEVLE